MAEGYSPQAQLLLAHWTSLSCNMRSVILRARYLQRKADRMGPPFRQELELRLHRAEVDRLYRQIGLALRELSSSDGVEKEFPEADATLSPPFIGRFVDFHISEEAIPGLLIRIRGLNGMVLQLLARLCAIRVG
jgi:hypothetical protein